MGGSTQALLNEGASEKIPGGGETGTRMVPASQGQLRDADAAPEVCREEAAIVEPGGHDGAAQVMSCQLLEVSQVPTRPASQPHAPVKALRFELGGHAGGGVQPMRPQAPDGVALYTSAKPAEQWHEEKAAPSDVRSKTRVAESTQGAGGVQATRLGGDAE